MFRILKYIAEAALLFLLAAILISIVQPLLPAGTVEVGRQELTGTASSARERVCCIDSNEEALTWRLRMIGAAKERIVLSTFDMRTDNSGTDVMAALYQAAERGVQVQVLLDGIYEPFFLIRNSLFDTFCAHPNIEVRLYNPIRLKNLCHANYRMHDKYLMIDERMYLLGGRNTIDTFLGEYTKGSNIDREILVYEGNRTEDTSLQMLEAYFQQIWNEERVEIAGKPVKAETAAKNIETLKLRYTELQARYPDMESYDSWEEATCPAERITLLHNGTKPEKKQPAILSALEDLTAGAADIQIQTPYVICDKAMYAFLRNAAGDADLEIILNAVEKGSNPWGCTDYLNNREKVWATGADVYELMNEYPVHTKALVIDDDISVVGSWNLDMRSTYLDTELMLVIESEPLNARIRQMNEVYKSKSKAALSDGTVTLGEHYEPIKLSLPRKLSFDILRVLIRPIRHLL